MVTVRTRKSAVERKSEIVETAIRLSAEIGPDRLTTDILAREVGITQPAIFRHFPTKNDIWEAVAERIGEMMSANARQSLAKSDRPIDKLRYIVVGHLAFIEATPAIPAILFSRELHAENENLRTFYARMIASRHRTLSQIIKEMIETGQFRKNMSADDAAFLILALIQGVAMRWSLNNRNFSLAKEGDRLLSLLFAGFTGNST